ncbi:hypothetical protein [Paracidovorax anthurii]|uniref:hypothetical protein n=1 Tax=Paracidovorax anthurii TaxID=78229 RepID=UPI0011BD6234|nr:hypothetical protein [Paracidovorax anthurii]
MPKQPSQEKVRRFAHDFLAALDRQIKDLSAWRMELPSLKHLFSSPSQAFTFAEMPSGNAPTA